MIRVPEQAPADMNAEQFTLGAIFMSPPLLERFGTELRLRPEHFYWRETHGTVYEAMLTLEERGVGIDTETVRFELERRGVLAAGGTGAQLTVALLQQLASGVPGLGNATEYAGRVIKLAGWRARLSSVYSQLEAIGRTDDDAFEEAYRLATMADVDRDGLMGPEDLASEWMDWYEAKESTAITLPWPRLTKALFGGLRPGDTTVVAGHSGMGKSTAGDQLLEHAKVTHALAGCVYVNEMSRIDRVSRLLAARARVPFRKIMERTLNPEEVKRVLREAPRLPFSMQPCSGWSADQIARHIRHYRWPIAFVDLATRIPASTTAEWDHVSGVLNDAARVAGTHLFIAVQLNRERNDKAARQMPVLRDLRNTGAWEADARNVLFVHRREEVDRDTDLPVLYDDGVLQLAKVSNGRPDAERVFLNYGRMRFEELQTTADTATESEPSWP